ncbi:unannotated protein [freshwater metagenome]|uniref:hydroxymethylbilane synthase n=1 Tax=freshwater metagenome TaxID=449393 RepID=A0A6J7DWY9_9ZZZZ|nr:hydroxymethylbilane synthase [Actinomycetota bacterium]
MRIGTRGSALALAQAGQVAAALGPQAELVTITTAGDRSAGVGDKERWVRELDAALLDGRIDAAVHSAKDVPAVLPEGLTIGAVPARAAAADVLCGAPSLDALSPGARIGTASLRRAAQLRALRDDLAVTDLHGNVDTRLRRLHAGEYDAIVLGHAGLQRLGLDHEVTGVLTQLVPCAGQGALAVAVRTGEAQAVAGLDDADAHACLRAERAVVLRLEADCSTPMGAYATIGERGAMTLTTFVGSVDAAAWVRDTLTGEPGEDPARLGTRAAERLLAAGAAEVLGR